MMNFNKYIVSQKASILDAMKKIEENKKGFVVVLENSKLVGTLTDGDLRRSLILGKELSCEISGILKPTFEYLLETAQFDEIVEKFKGDKIDFLPVVSEEGDLKNIILKKQMHEMLLKGETLNLTSSFEHMDDKLESFEIFNRPWGFYKTVFLSEFVQAKIIHVFSNQQLSLQFHKKREEHWVIIKGTGLMTIGESQKTLNAGDYIFIPTGCQHRIKNVDKDNPLIISEVQLGTYFGEDDIIRIEDDYKRI